MNNRQTLTKAEGDRIIAEVTKEFTPELCERETEKVMNRRKPKACPNGRKMAFSMAVGAFRCSHCCVVRSGGTVVSECASPQLAASFRKAGLR